MNKNTILKNLSWLTLLEIPSQVIGVLFYVILARSFGQATLGLYAYIFSLMTIVSLFLDFGFSNLFWRKWSVHFDSLIDDISDTLGARIVLITVLSLCLFLYVFRVDRGWSIYLLLGYIYTLLDSIRMIPVLYFQARNDFQKVFIVNSVDRFAPLLLGIIIILNHGTLVGIFIGLILSRLGSVVVGLYTFPELLRARPNVRRGSKLLPLNLLVFSIGLLNFIYFKVDTIMIRLLQDVSAVGLYSAAYRIVDTLVVIPTFFIFAAFPTLTKLHESNEKDQLQTLLNEAMKYLSVISVFTAIFFTFYAKEILIFLYKDQYVNGARSLQILGWAVVFYFLTSPLVFSIFSSKKDKFLLFRLATLTAFNIILNLFLIPKFGINGAAFSTLATEAISFCILFSYAKLRIDFEWVSKLMLVGALLSILLISVHYYLFPTLLVSGVVYLALLFALRVVTLPARSTLRDLQHILQ